ncbi:MAG: PxKF domain-containing protein [Actinobacteria bacterium]|nr:PxKF domain-containing protein [Actinomycetota bacterium]
MRTISRAQTRVRPLALTACLALLLALTGAFPALASPDSFTATGSMSNSRDSHQATVLGDGTVLVTGGFGGTRSADLYDPATGSFTAVGPMKIDRAQHQATLLGNGKVLITGGSASNSVTAELYDPVAKAFSTTGLMTSPRWDHRATLLGNGKVLITGGRYIQTNYFSSAELYDPNTGKFSAIGSMTTPRALHQLTTLTNGKVLITGGGSNKAELYDPGTGTFSATGSMNAARSFGQASLLADGRVLVTGGHDGTDYVNSAEVYDPVAGTFSDTNGAMTTARGWHHATTLNDGSVLIAGGRGTNSSYLNDAELYDPGSGTFSSTSTPMTTARAYHAAAALADGTVLIVGGTSGTGTLNSAELYHPAVAEAPEITGVPDVIGPPTPFTVSTSVHAATAGLTITGTPAPTLSLQWELSPDGQIDWRPIEGATDENYVIEPNAANQYLRVLVTASNGASPDATAASEATHVLGPAYTPTVGTPVPTADGFTVQVTNFRLGFAWSVSSDAGEAVIDSGGVVKVTGLSTGQAATVTITTSRSGFEDGITQVTGNAFGFDFSGFGAPLSAGVNLAKAGSTIPVKFSLGGYQGMDIFVAGSPSSGRTSCEDTTVESDLTDIDNPGSSGLSYDEASDTYQFNWKTSKNWKGQCRNLTLKFTDLSTQRASFSLR